MVYKSCQRLTPHEQKMKSLWLTSFVLPLALSFESHLKDLVRSECLVIANSPSWIHDGPLIRVEDSQILQGWDQSLGISVGTSCLDIVYFGQWNISSLEPWKGLYQDYSIINVMGLGEGFQSPKIPVQVKVYDQGCFLSPLVLAFFKKSNQCGLCHLKLYILTQSFFMLYVF